MPFLNVQQCCLNNAKRPKVNTAGLRGTAVSCWVFFVLFFLSSTCAEVFKSVLSFNLLLRVPTMLGDREAQQ